MKQFFLTTSLLLASAPALADTLIAGAPGWTLVNDPAGCWAESGADVHLKALVNRSGHLVLAAARPDWHSDSDRVEVRLQAGDRTQTIQGSMLVTIVMVGIDDAAFQDKILNAPSLTWHLPWGDFVTPVDGIGDAFAAVAECQRNRPQ